MKSNLLKVLLLAALAIPAYSCQKDEGPKEKPKPQGAPTLNSMSFAPSATDVICTMDWDKNGQAIIKWGATIAETEEGVKAADAISVVGNNVLFCDLKPSTKYYVQSFAMNSKGTTYSDVESFSTKAAQEKKAVDLGLSVKWANYNLGASAPEDLGYYYFWGYSEGRNGYISDGYSFLWDNYKYFSDNITPAQKEFSKFSISKYCNLADYGLGGKTDTLTALEAGDDAAIASWGGKWRMPTAAEWSELLENCSLTLATHDGLKGYEVKAKNGNSIFLPLAGNRSDIRILTVGSFGNYWSSSLCVELCTDAWCVALGPSSVTKVNDRRDHGYSVRAVME